MQTLSRHNRSEVSFLLNRNYESVFSRLKEVLTEDELGLFASVKSLTREMIWMADDKINYQPYSIILEADKDEVSEILQQQKESILSKIKQDNELGTLSSFLFIVPSDSDIYVGRKNDGSLDVKLTKWACKNARGTSSIDPLYIIVNRPKSDHFPVNLQINYSDGINYSNSSFLFTYKERTKIFNTNENGIFLLGLLKKESNFSVLQSEDLPETTNDFTVKENQEEYHVVFPYYLDFKINVIDQKGNNVPNKTITLNYGTQHYIYTTNEEGEVNVSKLILSNEDLIVTDKDNLNNKQVYQIDRSTENIVFTVNKKYYGNVLVKVINENNEAIPNYPLNIKSKDEQANIKTDLEGIFYIGRREVGEEISIESVNVNSKFTVEEGDNEFVIRLKKPPVVPPELITVKLINHNEDPIPDISMKLQIRDTQYQEVTNTEGIIRFEKNIFTDKEKVKFFFTIKNEKGKNKSYKKKIKYDINQNEYTLKLRKRRWLWLLLLLLPLLLLIECEKDITVETLESSTQNYIPNTEVNLNYTKFSLFNFSTKRFFTSEKQFYTQNTGENGKTTFSNLSYTLYSAIFKRNTATLLSAYNTCYNADSSYLRFHSLKTHKLETLYLPTSTINLDFLVVDKEDNEPLPQANIIIQIDFEGTTIIDSANSKADGKVVFNNIPKCGKIRALGNLEGYFPDSIQNKTVEEISKLSIESARKLKLTPVKDKIVFFVTNCKTGEPLPNAIATIHLKKQYSSTTKKAYTNINGIGKGEYDDAHIISKLRIEVRKKFFKNSIWDKNMTVKEFMMLPDSARVICLEPEEKPLTFINVDSDSKRRLPGVHNTIYIERNSSPVDSFEEISNKNGVFTISGLNAGDKITIYSYLNPCYRPNKTTIVKKEVTSLLESSSSQRTIPLKPKEYNLTFKTFDPDADTLVDNASLVVTIDGRAVQPTNSGNGEFTVKGGCNSTVSIVADKVDYQMNDTKIRGKSFEYLRTSPQSERNIPLRMKPCDQSTNGNTSGQQYYIDEFNMKQNAGEFIFEYYTDTEPDEITVYCGRKNEIGAHNVLFHYFDATNANTFQEKIRFRGCSIITVEVKGGSHWRYTVNCP